MSQRPPSKAQNGLSSKPSNEPLNIPPAAQNQTFPQFTMRPPPPPPGLSMPPGYSFYPPPTWPANTNNIPQYPPPQPHLNANTAQTLFNPFVPVQAKAKTNIDSKVANAPWHKATNNTPSTPKPSYSSVTTANIKINVNKAPSVLPVKHNSPIAVSTGQSTTSVAPKTQWSSNVKAFVERAFAACKNPTQRDKMEQVLRIKIKETISAGKMTKTNWEIEPIPQIFNTAENQQQQSPVKSSNLPQINKPAFMDVDEKKRIERSKRFEADQKAFNKQQDQNRISLQNVRIEDNQGDVIDWDEYTIVGTCQKLEKPYLRLTSAPDPATVRPLPVLKSTLKFLKDKWKNGADYGYICDQFKSLRQDMTVQRIKSDFTVQVYEIHARIAIEKGDLGQYNQCQTQLKSLYALGLSGCESEFLAYRLLYLIHCRNKLAINQYMDELNYEQKEHPAVAHALQVRSACDLLNYFQLFKLYSNAPNMGVYLMDLFIPHERVTALKTILMAYRPTISVSFLKENLCFSSEIECKEWLKSEFDITIPSSTSNDFIDCKNALTCVNSK